MTTKSCALPIPTKFKVESPVHALQLARELIRPVDNWTREYLAIDGNGHGVKVKSAKAEAFCALGALLRVNTKHEDEARNYLEQAAMELEPSLFPLSGTAAIFKVNDSGGNHRRVLKMFTRAIQLAKKAALP